MSAPSSFACFASVTLALALSSIELRADATVSVQANQRFTLEQALDRVITTDHRIAIADYEVRKARLEKLRAASRYYPNLSFSADSSWRGSATRETVEIQELPAATTPPSASSTGAAAATPTGTAPVAQVVPRIVRERRWSRTHSDQQSMGLNLSQPILDFTVAPARRQGELSRQIAEWQLRQRLREVLFAVAEQYFEVIKQEHLVEENRKTLGLTTEQLRQAQVRLKADEVIQSDVLQAQVDDERARRSVMEAEVSLALAKSRLAVMLDLNPQTSLDLVEPSSGRSAAKSMQDAIAVAQSRREDLHIAQLTLHRTQAERDELKARYAPTVDFQLGGDLATGSDLDRRDSWSAGVSFNWALFDRGQRELDLQGNQLQLGQDTVRIQDAMRTVSNDVIDAWYFVDRLTRRKTSLEIERTAAEANHQVQQGKYQAGLATSIEVQQALRDLARVRIESVTTAYDLETAYRDLENVLAVYETPRIDSALQRLVSPVISPVGRPTTPAAAPAKQPKP